MYRSNRSFNIPPPTPRPGIPRASETFAVPWRREFNYQSPPGGGEFELHPRFLVKSRALWAVMGDAMLDDFRGKDCAFVANCWFSPDVIRVSIFGHPPSWFPWPVKFMLSRMPILQSCLVFCAINPFGNGPIRRRSLWRLAKPCC